MKIPNANRAVVDPVKLVEYCLSAEHPRGRHKARVFEAALGFTSARARELRELLLVAVQGDEAILGERDQYGQRYAVDFAVSGYTGQATVRSLWIVRAGEDFPRFTSCYVL